MRPTIRKARAQDYDSLCELYDQVDALHREKCPDIFCKPQGPARDRNYILGLIEDENTGLFVADREGKLAGFIHAIMRDTPPLPIMVPRRYAVVDTMAVRQDSRRIGIGQALMDKACQWAAGKGAAAMELNVYRFNEGAIAFYQALGYQAVRQQMSKAL